MNIDSNVIRINVMSLFNIPFHIQTIFYFLLIKNKLSFGAKASLVTKKQKDL